MANRLEFSKKTKRDALRRSQMLCEAIGAMYGLSDGQRCNAPLAYGVQYDHIVLAANGGDKSLENCAAVCVRCHGIKTTKHDTPMAAKTVRMQDKALNIRTVPVKKLSGPGFAKSEKAAKREPKPSLPPRALYQERQS